jgi:hypothetical protein
MGPFNKHRFDMSRQIKVGKDFKNCLKSNLVNFDADFSFPFSPALLANISTFVSLTCSLCPMIELAAEP